MNLRSIAETSESVRLRQVSPVELTRECLKSIDRLDPTLNASITVMADSAMAEARQAEREIQSERWRGHLHGIPVGLKDLIDTAGVRTTAASEVFKDRIPAEDAEVVKKLKAAGAVIIGKQNLHEFAYGGSSLISYFGPVRNPVNPEFITGGSSGGSAAAVASGMCYAAIGTDTAGSIREPAALCGVVGLKPSYGLVSAKGVVPLSVSLDHVGPITRSVEDAAIVLDAITDSEAGYRATIHNRVTNLRLGIPRTYFYEDLDPDVTLAVECTIQHLQALGANLVEVEAPVNTDRTLQSYESYDFHRKTVATSPELYQPETLRRIRSGQNVTPAQYESAQRDLETDRTEIAEVFRRVDLLVTPTTPIPPPRIAGLMKDTAALRPAELMLLRNTRPVNVWGLPAISIPCGRTSAGLPIGLQIIGPARGEKIVLQLAYWIECIQAEKSRPG